jgi:hypothetical protein
VLWFKTGIHVYDVVDLAEATRFRRQSDGTIRSGDWDARQSQTAIERL